MHNCFARNLEDQKEKELEVRRLRLVKLQLCNYFFTHDMLSIMKGLLESSNSVQALKLKRILSHA
jgi:hypothetical protein